MKKVLTIKVDVDGVIRNLPSALCCVYNALDNVEYKIDNDIDEYDVNKSFPDIKRVTGMTANEYFFVKKSTEVFREKAMPYCGVKTSMERLLKKGHKEIICTWQPTYQAKIDTLGFLEDWKIPYTDIFFSKEKHQVFGDYIIDDNPDFLLNRKETARTILIRQPYNIKYEEKFNLKFDSLKHAVDALVKNPYLC